ncbi:MAG: helix-turn-helix domain-containing protein [Geminicoccaceae bacterium]
MSDQPHPTDIRVGRLLRERRLALGMTQERLGGLLGVTYQQVQKYERGTNRIGSSRLKELCGILGVQPNFFFEERELSGFAEAGASSFEYGLGPALSADSRALIEAFETIADRTVRRRILELVQTLAIVCRQDNGSA